MPVTRSRTGFYDVNLDQTNTTRFLFGDEDATHDVKYHQTAKMDDNFPTLTRREDQPNMVSSEVFPICFCPYSLFNISQSLSHQRHSHLCTVGLLYTTASFISHFATLLFIIRSQATIASRSNPFFSFFLLFPPNPLSRRCSYLNSPTLPLISPFPAQSSLNSIFPRCTADNCFLPVVCIFCCVRPCFIAISCSRRHVT